MNLRPLAFMDVSRLAATYTLLYQRQAVESRDKLDHDVKHLWLWQDGVENEYEKPWKAAKQFLTRLRNEAAPVFNGSVPTIKDAVIRSMAPGGKSDWSFTSRSGSLRLDICLLPSPGGWIYSGGEGMVLNYGQLTYVNDGVLNSEVNFGPVSQVKLVVDLLLPTKDEDANS